MSKTGASSLNYQDSARNSFASNEALLWFALHVRSRYEDVVARLLESKGYEWFLPTYTCRRQWCDRIKEMKLPLFPGYLFCRFNPHNRLPILTTPGLISIVGRAKEPTPIEETEIAALRMLMRANLPREPWPYLQVGQRVRMEYGPLCGLEGILLELKRRHRIVLSVTILQRSVAVEINDAWVTPFRVTSSSRAAMERSPQSTLGLAS